MFQTLTQHFATLCQPCSELLGVMGAQVVKKTLPTEFQVKKLEPTIFETYKGLQFAWHCGCHPNVCGYPARLEKYMSVRHTVVSKDHF